MKRKILVILLILVFLYCIGGVIYSIFVRQIPHDKPVNNEEHIVKIEGFNYTMNETKANKVFKSNFNELKTNLESDNIDYEKYALSLSKLFIIDFYTLNNKTNKYDIGGTQYIYEDAVENFKLKASETLYKYIEDNTEEKGSEKLPLVSEVFANILEETTYKIDKEEYPAYKIKVEWLYEKDLGYDTSAELILIRHDKYISIVEENRVGNNE